MFCIQLHSLVCSVQCSAHRLPFVTAACCCMWQLLCSVQFSVRSTLDNTNNMQLSRNARNIQWAMIIGIYVTGCARPFPFTLYEFRRHVPNAWLNGRFVYTFLTPNSLYLVFTSKVVFRTFLAPILSRNENNTSAGVYLCTCVGSPFVSRTEVRRITTGTYMGSEWSAGDFSFVFLPATYQTSAPMSWGRHHAGRTYENPQTKTIHRGACFVQQEPRHIQQCHCKAACLVNWLQITWIMNANWLTSYL